jgi:4-amino-4-deoxy-L-arabinose transferase-like glycosyltransferase
MPSPFLVSCSVLEDRRTLWVILAVSFVLFLIGNLPWQLDDYDQAKQAFTSFQMVNEGRWLYQQTPHQHVATKPPLVGWISAALFIVTRSWDLAWRLPSLVAAVALALLLFRSAESAYGLTAGLLALGAFGLNLLTPRLATLVRTDMLLALVIFGIGLLIWKKIRDETGWRLRDRFYLFGLLTIAMLIKGPIVYAFLLPGMALFQWRGRVGALRRLDAAARRPYQSAWPGWWPWIASLALFLLWVIGGIVLQRGFFDEVVMREFMARFGETIHRPQPLYFYLPHLLHKFAPWSLLLLAIAFVDLSSRNWRLRSAFREMSPEVFWLLCWSLGGLIVMSLIPSKRVDRIFPVIPPLCLLLAAQIGRVGAPRRLPKAFGTAPRFCLAVALMFAILFTGGYTISKVISGYRHHRDALATFGRDVRRDAKTHHWRYEAVSAKDESLLLYLQKTRFLEPAEAIAEWNRGNLDALVASTQKASGLMRDLRDAALSDLKSTTRKEEQEKGYVLITH